MLPKDDLYREYMRFLGGVPVDQLSPDEVRDILAGCGGDAHSETFMLEVLAEGMEKAQARPPQGSRSAACPASRSTKEEK